MRFLISQSDLQCFSHEDDVYDEHEQLKQPVGTAISHERKRLFLFTKTSQNLLALTLDECQYKCYITPRTKEEANAKPKESVPEFSKK